MASASGPSLPHRTVSSIRTGTTHSPSGHGQSGPTSPRTPSRTVNSAFGSPSALRSEDEIIVVEFGARAIRAGFAGDPTPKAVLPLGPEHTRRVGDHRAWRIGHQDARIPRTNQGSDWAQDYELWRYDLREVDLGLVEDKLDRALREVFTKCV
jgi:hypothetical protein